ncbi:MAG: Os1348 family NHLP clan protein [Candidatus Edwardsbacteria bacterium]
MFEEALQTLLRRAKRDLSFRERYLADPEETLREEGIKLTPEEMEKLESEILDMEEKEWEEEEDELEEEEEN